MKQTMKTMKNIRPKTRFIHLFLFLSFILSFLFSASIFASSNPEADLKAVLSQVDSLQGNFKQEICTEKGKILQQCEGKMWLKKPGLFRWEVLGKDQRIVVADGKKVWDYDIDLEQVTVQPFTKGQSTAPIFFLTGDTNSLSKDFSVSFFNSADNSSAGKNINEKNIKDFKNFQDSDQVFELKPKSSQAAFQWIRIGFKNKALNELEVLDHLGQVSSFTFEKVQQNTSIEKKLFQFKTPKGVDVVGL